MSKNSMNLQDSFLNQIRKDGSEVKLVLLDGTELSGKVRGFDNFTLILSTRETQNLVYKHAIAQMVCKKAMLKRADAPGAAPPGKRKFEPGEHSETKKEDGFNKLDLSKVQLETPQST